MAKTKRVKIGSICKEKDGDRFYLQVFLKDKDGKPGSYVLRDGQYLSLETKAQQLEDVAFLIKENKVDAETGKYLLDKANKIKDFVKFEVIAKESK